MTHRSSSFFSPLYFIRLEEPNLLTLRLMIFSLTMTARNTSITLILAIVLSVYLSVVLAVPIVPEEPQVPTQIEQRCTYVCSYLPGHVPEPSLFLNDCIYCVYYDPIAEKTCMYNTIDGTSNDQSCTGKLQLLCGQTKQTFNPVTQTDVRRRLEGRQWSAAKERARAREREAARRKRR